MNQNNSPIHKLENNPVLFVSDLSRDVNEEDVYNFFKNYHCTQVKINKYSIIKLKNSFKFY
jgi:RNA recognition motif-containing protein